MTEQMLSAWFYFSNAVALAACVYVAGGAICRNRHSRYHIKRSWTLIYFGVLCLAAWAGLEILLQGINTWSALVCVGVAAYMHLTREAWDKGVPVIAQPKPLPEKLRSGPFDRRRAS